MMLTDLTTPTHSCLDPAYSTTRLVTGKAPIINNPIGTKFKSVLFLSEGEGRNGEGGLRTKNYFKKDMSNKPLITVITVVFNAARYLEDTILSVLNQTYDNIEYILIDGGSRDGTIDILKKYEGQIDYWLSEKDGGIYDAMNKGINLSTGGWIYFLGGDDRLSKPDITSIVASCMQSAKNEVMIIYGNVYNNNGQLINSTMGRKILLHNTIHHQSCFYNRQLFKTFRYSTTTNIISDYELNLITYIKKYNHIKIIQNIAICNDGGMSTNRANYFKCILETNTIRKKHLGRMTCFIMKILYGCKAIILYVIRYNKL